MTKTHHEVGSKQMKSKEAMDVKQRRPLVFKEYEPGQQVFRDDLYQPFLVEQKWTT